MLTSYSNQLSIEILDSTVYVLPGSARIGNTIMPYDGSRITYQQMSSFTDSSKYQNALLYLNNFYDAVDMTRVLSSEVSTLAELTYPVMGIDGTYSSGHPLGLFTLYSNDGTDISLIDYKQP